MCIFWPCHTYQQLKKFYNLASQEVLKKKNLNRYPKKLSKTSLALKKEIILVTLFKNKSIR